MVFTGLIFSILFGSAFCPITIAIRSIASRWIDTNRAKQRQFIRLPLLAFWLSYNLVFYFFEYPQLREMQSFIDLVHSRGGGITLSPQFILIPLAVSFMAWLASLAFVILRLAKPRDPNRA